MRMRSLSQHIRGKGSRLGPVATAWKLEDGFNQTGCGVAWAAELHFWFYLLSEQL